MSYAIDVNILLYASDQHSKEHGTAAAFLRGCVGGREVFCLAWVSVMSYLRIATHPRIFTRPLSQDEAVHNIESLITVPHCRIISEEEGFWDRYRAITQGIPTRGNFVPDAHLAALLSQHGVMTLYTHDRDFRRFEFLDVRDPLV